MLKRNALRAGLLLLVWCLSMAALGGPASAQAAAEVTGLTAGSNQVTITADSEITGYPFVMQNPLRIVVDVRGAGLKPGLPRTVQGSGAIDRVEVASLPDAGSVRVTVFLNQDATYALEEHGDTLVLKVRPSGAAPADDTADAIPYEEDVRRDMDDVLTPDEGPVPEEGKPSMPDTTDWDSSYPGSGQREVATTIQDVYYRSVINGVQIMIKTDGIIDTFVDYEMYRPSRLVIELPCVDDCCLEKRLYPIRFMGVSKIKVDQHYGSARVTITFAKKFRPYDVKRTASGIVVTVFESGTFPSYYKRAEGIVVAGHDVYYIPGGVDYKWHITGVGQTLEQLATTYYGDPAAWRRILSANRRAFIKWEVDCIEGNCGEVRLGQALHLRIPVRW